MGWHGTWGSHGNGWRGTREERLREWAVHWSETLGLGGTRDVGTQTRERESGSVFLHFAESQLTDGERRGHERVGSVFLL